MLSSVRVSGGPTHTSLTNWAQTKYAAYFSPPLLAEYEATYENLRRRYPNREPINWVTVLAESAELVFPEERITGASPDPFDDMVLECAVAAKMDFVVSGDKKYLLQLGEFRGIPIISPIDFLARLTSQ